MRIGNIGPLEQDFTGSQCEDGLRLDGHRDQFIAVTVEQLLAIP